MTKEKKTKSQKRQNDKKAILLKSNLFCGKLGFDGGTVKC